MAPKCERLPRIHTRTYTKSMRETDRKEISVKEEHIQATPPRSASVRAAVGRVGAPRSTAAAQLIIAGPTSESKKKFKKTISHK